ncbi:hypothetical protein KP77_33100 [Jeotgalibacillus alimentarius]|uniref:Uncharacterized protein n=1 Tax=Jeotgalibacillus alimentarius TaxID=135826 RepID=A0A0C2RPD0_9BACL|nr:hypothetical protein [Jeotgalibacillus alimentarius]KIL43604.1 hypothetical protein KP77_33100 [Jeotgalibacillus alimentarius]
MTQTLEPGRNYSGEELKDIISKEDILLLSSNEDQLFTDSSREYRVVSWYEGYHSHGPSYQTKRAYIVEKV